MAFENAYHLSSLLIGKSKLINSMDQLAPTHSEKPDINTKNENPGMASKKI